MVSENNLCLGNLDMNSIWLIIQNVTISPLIIKKFHMIITNWDSLQLTYDNVENNWIERTHGKTRVSVGSLVERIEKKDEKILKCICRILFILRELFIAYIVMLMFAKSRLWLPVYLMNYVYVFSILKHLIIYKINI